MNILILGAGTVGSSIADLLCQREHNVTVVDTDPKNVQSINDSLDVRAVLGSGSQSSTMFQAGVASADICLAVTGNDEVNIIGASMAKAMGARRSIARVFAPIFRDLSSFDYQDHFNIDRMLSLEHLTAMRLARSIRNPGSVVVEQYARGGLQVQEIVVTTPSKVTQKPVRELGLAANVRLGTIQRENRMWMATADDQIELGDRVSVFSRPEDSKSVRTLFKSDKTVNERVVIAGGGETGFHLASTLEREGFRVMLMETDEKRCNRLSTRLQSTKIVNCDATVLENLHEERVGNADVFVACTGKDENNIMLCVEAKETGVGKVMATVKRPDYASVVEKLGIDVAVSQREVMAQQILSYITSGNIISQATLPGGLINIVELEVMEGSIATETTLAELGLPERSLVVAVIRHDDVRVPGANDRIAPSSHLILLAEEDVVDAAIAKFTHE